MSPEPPPGLTARGATREDREAVAALIAESDLALVGSVDYEIEDLDEEWGRPRFEVSRDTVVLESADGALAGYAYTWEKMEGDTMASTTVPHPERGTEEVRRFLIAFAESRARAIAERAGRPVAFQNAIYESEEDHARLLREIGMAPVRYFWRMTIALDGEAAVPEPQVPEGVTIRPFVAGADDERVHAAMREAFAEHWSNTDPDLPEWRQQYLESPNFDAGLWFVAEADGEVAGALLAQRTGRRGWVSEVGVRPAYRGRGIAGALLQTVFAEFARRGFEGAALSVDSENVTGATRVYERVGMTSKFRFDFYEKTVEPA